MNWTEAKALIDRSGSVAIVTHSSPPPDADAVGSAAAVAELVRQMGKQYRIFLDVSPAQDFAFLASEYDIHTGAPDTAGYDCVVFTDASDLRVTGQAGAAFHAAGLPTLVIDHHATNSGYGTINLIDAQQTSACELIYDWIQAIGFPVDVRLATALLTGIVGDTQALRVGNITPALFHKIGVLLAAGADFSMIVGQVITRKPRGLLKLKGRALANARTERGVMWTALAASDYAGLPLQVGDSPDVVTEMLSEDGVRVSATFIAHATGEIKVSMRAKQGHDVARIAAQYGGGGHKQAAGCTLNGLTLEAAQAQLVPLLQTEAERITT